MLPARDFRALSRHRRAEARPGRMRAGGAQGEKGNINAPLQRNAARPRGRHRPVLGRVGQGRRDRVLAIRLRHPRQGDGRADQAASRRPTRASPSSTRPSPMPTTRPRSPPRCRPARARTWCSSSTAGSTTSSPAKFVQPLPTDAFPPEMIEKEFFPIVDGDEARRRILRAADRGALAGAVLQQEAVPGGRARSEQAAADARRVRRRRQEDGQARRRRQHHLGRHHLDMAGQDHHWWREVLVRQFGGEPYIGRRPQGDLRQRGRAQGAAVLHRPAARSTRSARSASWTRRRPPSAPAAPP